MRCTMAGTYSALPGAGGPGDIQVGSLVILQDGYALGDASWGFLKVGELGTVVEISSAIVNNSNACEDANDGSCDEYDTCPNGTDTADCSKLSGSNRLMLDTCLVVVVGAAAETCKTTHAGISAGGLATSLFTVSLLSYFQLGSPSMDGLAFSESGVVVGIRPSIAAGNRAAQRRGTKSYKVFGNQVPGLRWKNIGSTRPRQGQEFYNSKLREQLCCSGRDKRFTLEKWLSFGIEDLRHDSYIRSGDDDYGDDYYFTPYVSAWWYPEGAVMLHTCLDCLAGKLPPPSRWLLWCRR
jgi:hypothetical protein